MFFSYKDTRIYYEEYGPEHGQAMILLHGNGEDHTYFRYQIAHFQERFHVYALDTRGHGRSTHGKRTLDFDLLAEDVHAFVLEKGLEHLILLGFSDGGNIAIAYALHYPEQVDSMILNGANLWPEGMERHAYRSTVRGYRILEALAQHWKKAQRKLEVFGLMVHHPHFTLEELGTLRMPVLVIAGEHDMIQEKHTQAIARALPNSRLVIMKKADHFCARKCPVRFNRLVDQFLKKVRKTDE
ncbi:MAG: alpha/beta hydrolase [Lachnospiraceae bacterium]|nr:alpha/beta hydrolase [Lachnospiraceae bacterium]